MGKILLVTGDKGGVGKSIVSRLLYDYLSLKNFTVGGYDCDKRNAQLYRHCGRRDDNKKLMTQTALDGISRIDISSDVGLGILLDDLHSHKPDYALVDLPASAHGLLEKTEAQFTFCEAAKGLDYSITLIHVLSRVKDSAYALERLIDFFGDKATYIAVKNGFFGDEDRFRRFDKGPARDKIEEQKGKTIYIPDLYDDIIDIIDEHNMTFRSAKHSDLLPFSLRHMVSTWINRAFEQFEKAGV